ncbi:precorrin-6A/cobalt-precorrin-6A reductase [Planktotalea frisia]|jgi:precorrin-6A/cobalt-precorrin-6A reductase|uniref:Precorrin-6A reductase n=1 Tax=Planktotalea frisia TaxID=696762 RepID=A0A1L9NZ34_9RHOB|nr:cobalt-precorrin-6A reductase [Planktotalea frisia]OJI94424.1 precorrin-6A reductase [Planktotalea frisia]PZX30070.1 precorrin-6A/cobalt-precorrin-6A reductase [Planktotalea frisia]
MTLLILSGTGEGRRIAAELHSQGIDLIASLAGETRNPKDQIVPLRIGGFGGEEGFRRYLAEAKISAVLDVTHPFASEISERSARICADLMLPYCIFARPPWTPNAQDDWTELEDESAAAQYISAGATVFLATGRKTLHRFADLSKCRLICRQIDPPDGPFPFANGEFLIGRPPFSVEDEIALFDKLKVDWLIVKNAGGAASFSKLEAARALKLKVGMIKRPERPDAPSVSSIEQAVEWGKSFG